MVSRAILMIFMAIALMSGNRVMAAVDCSSLILNMADCLSFVTSGSTVEKPEGTCCSGLKTVVRSGPECLCEAFKNSASLGVTLDLTKAASLPSVCKVAAPPSARCGLSVSASPPTSAPDLSPTAGAGAPATFSGGGTAATPPVPVPRRSDASLPSVPFASAFFIALISSFLY